MNKLNILVIILTVITINVSAHKQEVHQYITREAFELLKMSFPDNYLGLEEMENFIGTNETNPSNAVNIVLGHGLMVSGAWIEDEYDTVYHYGIYNVPNYNDIPPWVESFFYHDSNRMAHTSITHFWNADNGENASTHLTDTIYGDLGQSTWSYTIPENAVLKMRRYFDGNYSHREIFPDGIHLPNYYSPPTQVTIIDWHLPGIIDLYHGNGAKVLDKCLDVYGDWIDDIQLSMPIYESRKQWAYNRLGRMSHLLQDMSVPVHVHNTAHAGNHGMYFDFYENNVLNYIENYKAWTAQG